MGESGVPCFGPRWGGGEGKGRKGRSYYRSAGAGRGGAGKHTIQFSKQREGGEREQKRREEEGKEEKRREEKRREDGEMESMYVNDREGEEDSCVVLYVVCRGRT